MHTEFGYQLMECQPIFITAHHNIIKMAETLARIIAPRATNEAAQWKREYDRLQALKGETKDTERYQKNLEVTAEARRFFLFWSERLRSGVY